MRRAQWKAATEGNVTAQIWWGKQFLGQRSYEQREVTGKDESPVVNQPDITAALSEHLSALRTWRRSVDVEPGGLVPEDPQSGDRGPSGPGAG